MQVTGIHRRRRVAALALAVASVFAAAEASQEDRFRDVLEPAERQGTFAGELVVQDGDRIVHHAAYGALAPGGATRHAVGGEWRWASVTKMVTALLVLEQVEAGRLELDAPAATYLPESPEPLRRVTLRQLLNHTSGLANPDAEGTLAWYTGDAENASAYCRGPALGAPGGAFAYNNCDFLVLADVLEAATNESFQSLVEHRLAEGLGLSSVRVVTEPGDDAAIPGYSDGGRLDRGVSLAVFGAGGALVGSAGDLAALNHALMSGKVLGQQATLAAFAEGVPELGYVALGAWAYEATPQGCEAPLRLVERRGDIEGVHVLTMLDIANDRSFAAFSNRAETDWGWLWAGEGLAADLASRAFCGGRTPARPPAP